MKWSLGSRGARSHIPVPRNTTRLWASAMDLEVAIGQSPCQGEEDRNARTGSQWERRILQILSPSEELRRTTDSRSRPSPLKLLLLFGGAGSRPVRLFV